MGLDVYDAARARLRRLFTDFDHLLVAFSGGKDSGVVLNLAVDVAREIGAIDKLALYYQDYEAGYRATHEYVARAFAAFPGRKWWLCLPISAACAVSMHQPRWIPWDADCHAIWTRPMPAHPYVVHEGNCPFPFPKGTKGFDARILFAEWFAAHHPGRTAVLIGLRAQESLSRRAIFTSRSRKQMHAGLRYTTRLHRRLCNAYPIYDWRTEDVWRANARQGWDYNRLYDLFYQAGLSIDQMRVASPFHQSAQASLHLYRVLDPEGWGRMVGRVNGCNFGALYGGTTAMGWRHITKPAHFTWRQYAGFLLRTLPHGTRTLYCAKIKKSRWHWRVQGGARSPEFIAQLEAEGWPIRRTGRPANRGHRRDELIYIDEMLDDTAVEEFKRAPTWKRVCVAIMKNDTTCLTMGFQRTKDQHLARQQALARYGRLQLAAKAPREEDE